MRELLPVLGDGAGRHNAEAAVSWAIERFLPGVADRVGTSASVDRLVGVNEVASILGQPRAVVLRWSNGQGRTDFPAPVLTLACGSHWDTRAIEQFAKSSQLSSGN